MAVERTNRASKKSKKRRMGLDAEDVDGVLGSMDGEGLFDGVEEAEEDAVEKDDGDGEDDDGEDVWMEKRPRKKKAKKPKKKKKELLPGGELPTGADAAVPSTSVMRAFKEASEATKARGRSSVAGEERERERERERSLFIL